MSETKCGESTTQSCIFPLYLYDSDSLHRQKIEKKAIGRPNLTQAFLKELSSRLNLKQTAPHGLPQSLTPEEIFDYTYAVFHGPTYRTRYAEFLRIDFPRIPITSSLELFHTLARLGGELVAFHLMESPRLDKHVTKFIGKGDNEVVKVRYDDQTVWINYEQGFKGVPVDVWDFHIGGYQVCEKWLKDRKGRRLSEDDITHYHKIVVAINETIGLMAEIDKVIDAHGGWPGAFVEAQNG
jgi:predicted helicase